MKFSEIDLNNKKGLLSDLDDTLYAYKPCHKAGYAACSALAKEKFGIEEAEFELYWKQSRNRVHNDLKGQGASHSRLLYAQKLGELFFGYTHPEFTLKMEETYWSVFLNTMQWNSEVRDFLDKAKEQGLRMCIVTDLTAQIQLKKWEKLELGNYFTFMVSSEEAGIEKPGHYMYQLALEKLGLNAEEAIMLGDSQEKDVDAPISIGIKSYLVREGKLIQ